MVETSRTGEPPMQPSDEASKEELRLAREQGEAYRKALVYMVQEEAGDGAEQPAGDYLVGYAVEAAEGMYERRPARVALAPG